KSGNAPHRQKSWTKFRSPERSKRDTETVRGPVVPGGTDSARPHARVGARRRSAPAAPDRKSSGGSGSLAVLIAIRRVGQLGDIASPPRPPGSALQNHSHCG